MLQTFTNLPLSIQKAISGVLSQQESSEWVTRAIDLHRRYTEGKSHKDRYIHDFADALGYLAMRAPATYAQIHGAMLSVKELLPSWEPKTMLDIGSGPATAVWAGQSLWPGLQTAVCIDQDRNVISLGKQILDLAELSVNISWKQQDVRTELENTIAVYDIVVIANVFNELSPSEAEKLLGQAFNKCSGILLIVEPGTPFGSSIVQNAAQKLANAGSLLAPYIGNSFVRSEEYWLHFPQRFIRPDFARRVRQHMRDSSLMASDWEEAKYAYTAVSKLPAEITPWGRCVGPVTKQKGFLEVPILTNEAIVQTKVMKRNKPQYAFAKDLKWGEIIMEEKELSSWKKAKAD